MTPPKKHKAVLGEFKLHKDFENPPGRELTCTISKKTVGAIFSKNCTEYPTVEQLLETLDYSCRGRCEDDYGLHVIENQDGV